MSRIGPICRVVAIQPMGRFYIIFVVHLKLYYFDNVRPYFRQIIWIFLINLLGINEAHVDDYPTDAGKIVLESIRNPKFK